MPVVNVSSNISKRRKPTERPVTLYRNHTPPVLEYIEEYYNAKRPMVLLESDTQGKRRIILGTGLNDCSRTLFFKKCVHSLLDYSTYPHPFSPLLHITLQNTIATSVLTVVANNAGITMAAGFAEPYWVR